MGSERRELVGLLARELAFFDELGNVQRDLHRAPPDAGSPMARRYHELKRHVRLWHFSDIPPALTNVRYGGKSGHDANGPLCRLMTYCGHWRSNISVGVALIYLHAHVRLFIQTQAFSRATTEHIPQVFWVWGKAVALLRYQAACA